MYVGTMIYLVQCFRKHHCAENIIPSFSKFPKRTFASFGGVSVLVFRKYVSVYFLFDEDSNERSHC